MKLPKIIKEFREIIGIPLLLLVFFFSPSPLQLIDPTAATWDWGVIQTVIPVGIIGLSINLLAFMGIKYNFPELYQRYLVLKVNELNQWQSLKALFFILLVYIALFTLLFIALI